VDYCRNEHKSLLGIWIRIGIIFGKIRSCKEPWLFAVRFYPRSQMRTGIKIFSIKLPDLRALFYMHGCPTIGAVPYRNFKTADFNENKVREPYFTSQSYWYRNSMEGMHRISGWIICPLYARSGRIPDFTCWIPVPVSGQIPDTKDNWSIKKKLLLNLVSLFISYFRRHLN
jgi:hypothetical protein